LKEIEIPFILWGKSIKKNFKIIDPVYQYDNAATVAFAFELKLPLACIGKPVKNAFVGFDELNEFPIAKRLKEPVIFPKAVLSKKAGGLYNGEATVVIENANEEGIIKYTLDGSMPSNTSNSYTEAFKVYQNTVLKSVVFTDSKISSMVNEAFFRVKDSNLKRPVSYEVFYLSNLESIPFLEKLTPNAKGNCFEITSDEIKETIKDNTVVRFKTYITIDKEDSYGFFTRSDDGSILKINNEMIVNNDGDHGIEEKAGKIHLKAGVYPLEVVWFNGGGDSWLDVFYQSSTIPKQILPTTILINKKL
jgi:hypothetical protein